MSSWPRWQTLRAADWGVLLRCLWLIPAVELSVRWRAPAAWLPRESAAAAPPMRPCGATVALAGEAARWVDVAYRRSPFTPTCLTRSLVLYRVLQARGLPCRLRIGLRKEQAELQGHAWVETRGDAPATDFEVVLTY